MCQRHTRTGELPNGVPNDLLWCSNPRRREAANQACIPLDMAWPGSTHPGTDRDGSFFERLGDDVHQRRSVMLDGSGQRRT